MGKKQSLHIYHAYKFNGKNVQKAFPQRGMSFISSGMSIPDIFIHLHMLFAVFSSGNLKGFCHGCAYDPNGNNFNGKENTKK